MVDRLKIPLELARLGIHSRDRVTKQVVTGPVPAVEVGAGFTDGQIQNAALLIQSQRKCPNIISGAILPTVVAPGLDASLTGIGDCVKLPHLFPTPNIVRAYVAPFSDRVLQ